MTTDTHILNNAPFASLQAVAKSEVAKGLVTGLVDKLVAWERSSGKRKRARDQQLVGLGNAVAAFTTDLLHAQNDPEARGWAYRPLAKGTFTGQPVSARNFGAATDGLKALGMLEVKPGYTQTVEFDPGEPTRTRGKSTRFRATAKLLEVCAGYGVTPQCAGEHIQQVINQFVKGDRHARRDVMAYSKQFGADFLASEDKALQEALAQNHQEILRAYVRRQYDAVVQPTPVFAPPDLADDDPEDRNRN